MCCVREGWSINQGASTPRRWPRPALSLDSPKSSPGAQFWIGDSCSLPKTHMQIYCALVSRRYTFVKLITLSNGFCLNSWTEHVMFFLSSHLGGLASQHFSPSIRFISSARMAAFCLVEPSIRISRLSWVCRSASKRDPVYQSPQVRPSNFLCGPCAPCFSLIANREVSRRTVCRRWLRGLPTGRQQ